MNYQTFEPIQNLRAVVRCYWNLESPKQAIPEKQTIVADGCMEMIFHYGDLYKQYLPNGESIVQPRCFVMGQLSRPLEIEPTGSTGIFSVRFQPDGFLPFATLPLSELENRAVALEVMFGKAGQEIEDLVLSATTSKQRIQHIEHFLLTRISDVEVLDRLVKSAVETIITANGQLSVDELSKRTYSHRRQLERKFSSSVGLSPKQLSKIIRLQATLQLLLTKKFTTFTALAHESEYYDQAHFIKDFKELTGFTPKEFYGDQLKMSALFWEME